MEGMLEKQQPNRSTIRIDMYFQQGSKQAVKTELKSLHFITGRERQLLLQPAPQEPPRRPCPARLLLPPPSHHHRPSSSHGRAGGGAAALPLRTGQHLLVGGGAGVAPRRPEQPAGVPAGPLRRAALRHLLHHPAGPEPAHVRRPLLLPVLSAAISSLAPSDSFNQPCPCAAGGSTGSSHR